MRQEVLCYQRLPLVSATSLSAFRALSAQSSLLLIKRSKFQAHNCSDMLINFIDFYADFLKVLL
jgi:hypothetical protein